MSATPPPHPLRDLARAQERQRDEDWRAAQDGSLPELRPIDAEEEARMMAALFPQAALAPAPVVPIARRRSWRLPALALAACLAGFGVWLGLASRGPALPAYTLTVLSGDQRLRSPGTSARYTRGSRVELVLQPAQPVEHPVDLTLTARDRGGRTARLAWPIERGRGGALRISTVLDDQLAPGPWTIELDLGDGAQRLQLDIVVEDPS